MTDAQADWTWNAARAGGYEAELPDVFPDVDWAAVRERERAAAEAQWQAYREVRGPRPAVTVDQVNEALRPWVERSAQDYAAPSPLYGRLKGGR